MTPSERMRVKTGAWVVTILLVLTGLLSSLSLGPLTDGWAQSGGAQSLADYRLGQVTAKPQGGTVQINNQDYPLSKNVTVTDENDGPRRLEDLEPGLGVKFHVKNGRIDHIVVLLPR